MNNSGLIISLEKKLIFEFNIDYSNIDLEKIKTNLYVKLDLLFYIEENLMGPHEFKEKEVTISERKLIIFDLESCLCDCSKKSLEDIRLNGVKFLKILFFWKSIYFETFD